MARWLLLALFAFSISAAAPGGARAEDEDGPSILALGWNGIFSGAAVGGAGGYLVGRKDGWKKSDWRAVGLGMGIGALAGAGLGVTLGIIDRAGAPGGRYVARDLSAGVGFGAVIGVIAGGIAAARNDKAEYALYGTAIGAIAGAGLGIITGIIEGAAKRRRDGKTTTTTTTTTRLKLQPSLDFARTSDGSMGVAMPCISGVF